MIGYSPLPENTQTERSRIAKLIDHTILKPEATREDIQRVAREAREYRFASVCVNPWWATDVLRELIGTDVKVCAVVAFPFGASPSGAKATEARLAILRGGASEIDMVLNIGALRSGDYDAVQSDIEMVVKECHDREAIVKVILETALLTDEQKVTACRLAQAAGADFVKTSTGFSTSGAKVEDVALMRQTVGPDMGVKASGGIRTLDDLHKMVAAGANRIGASASVQIIHAIGA